MTDSEREQLRAEIDQAMRPAVDQVIANATRPYKRLIVWLDLTLAVLAVLSIVQLVLWFTQR